LPIVIEEKTMSTDEQDLRWKIENVRESISLDWTMLASKKLPADRRKVIEEHLKMCNNSLSILKGLLERNQSPSQESPLEDHQPSLFGYINSHVRTADDRSEEGL
jgi:hypothetical protein